MNRKTQKTQWLVSVALMSAIVIFLANTPFGMIQLPVIKATTVHIPVIIGAIFFGPLAGAFLGGVFGICSLISNTTAPTLLSFAFSPFLSTSGFIGIGKALWISLACRILIGPLVGYLWIVLKKTKVKKSIALALAGFSGSLIHTLLVMSSIYLLFAAQYAQAREVAASAVFGLVMTTVFVSGIPEAVAAALLVLALGIPISKIFYSISK